MSDIGSKLEQATILYQRGQTVEAKALYEEVLRNDRGNFVAVHSLGKIMYLQGHYVEAHTLIEKALKSNPLSIEAHSHLGVVLQALSRHEEALASYDRALAIKPDYVEALNNRGNAMLLLGRFEEAVESYNRCLAFRPDYAEALANRANALLALKRAEEALDSCDLALAIKPDFAEPHYIRGAALLELSRFEQALESCDRALAIRSNYAEALCARGNALFHLKQVEEALACYDRALVARPDYIEALYNRGNALRQLGRAEAAVASYDRALAIRPNYVEALHDRAMVLLKLGQFDEALASIDRALALKPDLKEALNDRGNILQQLHRIDEALASYDKALMIGPDYADALYNRGWMLGAFGRASDAIECMERAIALNPRKPKFYLGLSHFTRLTKEDPHLQTMKTLVREVDRLSTEEQIELHYALGEAMQGIGAYDEAFYHLMTGATLKRQQNSYNEATECGSLERIKTVFDSDLIQSKKGGGFPSTVPVFIVGMPRSGSTLIEQALASHSKVFGAGELTDLERITTRLIGKTTAFPQSVALATNDDLYQLGKNYATMIQSKSPLATRIVDKQLGNFIFVGLMHMALPNARIIHSIRDPIDTCWSCFSNLFLHGQAFSYDLGELGRYYQAYRALMEHWQKVLPEGVILDVRYEELTADFEGQIRRVLAFCDLDWDEACLEFYRTERPVLTTSMLQVRRPVYNTSIGRWRRYATKLSPLLEALNDPS